MNPKLTVVAGRNGGVFSRREALECGYTGSQIRARLKSGVWLAVRRGMYAGTPKLDHLPPWDQTTALHLLAVRAAHRAQPGAAAVVSHQSAAALHGLPTWGLTFDHVHLTRLDAMSGRIRAGVRHHAGAITDADVLVVDGVAATAVARTVVDTACLSSYEAAVAVADAALHRRLTTPDELRAVLETVRGWPGSGTAQAAVGFADGRCESPGESRLRILMDNHGLPTPALQVPFASGAGVHARVDFYFRGERVIVEFDGMVKYKDDASAVVVKEKQREDLFRASGFIVVRVVWSDLDQPKTVVRRIAAALEQGRQASARALTH